MREAIDALAAGTGELGELLALGSRRRRNDWAKTPRISRCMSRGWNCPGTTRGGCALALGLAVGTRGADHNRSGAYEADFSNRLTRASDAADVVLAAIETEDRAALIDSLILCKFLRGVFPDLYAESAQMLRAVTGWDMTADELRGVALRVVNARKCVNIREGGPALRTLCRRASSRPKAAKA